MALVHPNAAPRGEMTRLLHHPVTQRYTGEPQQEGKAGGLVGSECSLSVCP